MIELGKFNCKKCGDLITVDNCIFNGIRLRSSCKNCNKKYFKNYYLSTTSIEKRQISHYKTRYGIELEIHKKLSEIQCGRCAICGIIPEDKLLSLDHDHITGEIRGLLCNNCNVAIGNLRENEDIIWNMMEYLKKYKWSKAS